MKFHYNPTSMKSLPILRRTLHVSLGFTAFVCLVLSISLGKYSSLNSTAIDLPMESSTLTSTNDSDLELKPIIPISKPVELLSGESQESWKTIKIKAGDTLSKIFNRLGISSKDIYEIMTADPASKRLASLLPGQTLKICLDRDQQIAGLVLELGPGSTLHAWRMEEGFQVEHKLTPLEKHLAFGKGAIQDSLFSAGKRAGLDSIILGQMVEIFGWNIDFSLDLRPNDTFRVLYEEKYLDGEKIQTGNILAAEIINNGKKHQAIRYTDISGNTAYYSPDGFGMHQAFLRAPVNFTRISSHFGARNHPILHKLRRHNGVDYSAPSGTPVQATGDGKVIFAGTRGGYGKVVELQHGARYSTLYAHLSRFPKNLKHGMQVKQGQIIGYVGRTGLATGNHLHYEFRIDGIHRNPLTVTLPKKNPITASNKRHFLAHAKEMIKLLDTHELKINVARGEYPINE